MTSLTIDENALLRLQEDIYNDTQKYYKIFNTPRTLDIDPHARHFYRQRGRGELRVEKYEYMYRMYNDGYSPIDGLHYETEW